MSGVISGKSAVQFGKTMCDVWWIDGGLPAVLEFSGPDAVRYLNGQVTQDVRRVERENICLPACVTDAKGRFQFRVWISKTSAGAIRVDGPADSVEELEQRLTRYLIADDVEVENATGRHGLWHVVGGDEGLGGMPSMRWGGAGVDLWLPAGEEPAEIPRDRLLVGEAWEAWRIARRLPVAGRELVAGVFPAEVGLEASDVSFHKGCYIGQEVISRIKSVGKVNRTLSLFSVDQTFPAGEWEILTDEGVSAGEVTSLSPVAEHGRRLFLVLVKRGRVPARVSCGGKSAPVAEVAGGEAAK
jgi:folate-binding protein YgfZ